MPVRAKPVSYVKAHLAQVITAVRGGEPMLITQKGTAAAVIEDAQAYQRTQDALAMLKLVALAKRDVARGRRHTHEQIFTEARTRLKARLHEQA